jgi:hypothetical protein
VHGGVGAIGRAFFPDDARSARNWFALALALLLHAALLNSVFRHSKQPAADSPPGKAMLWLKIASPLRKPEPAPIAPDRTKRSADKAAPAAVPALAPQAAPAIAVESAPTPSAPVSAEEMIRIAKQDLGKIDRELRKGNKESFSGSGDSAQRRLEKAFEAAHAAAPNKWYQAAKVEDITPPGDDARKIYKITTALGSYCVRYADKNRTWDHGQANLGEPLSGACPRMFRGP